MRNIVPSFSVASAAGTILAVSACAEATGTLTGGEPLASSDAESADAGQNVDAASPCPFDASTPGWQDLYACYFGPGGMASCGTPTCHNTATDLGATASNFVCGNTAQSCFQGMVAPSNGALAIVPAGGTSDATTTPLWTALHVSNPPGIVGNNMPYLSPFIFTSQDLANIRAWIQNGAQNN